MLELLLVWNRTAVDCANCFRYTGTYPTDCHLYGHEELRQYTYCNKYCSKRHRLRRLCNYSFYICYPFITFYLVFT